MDAEMHQLEVYEFRQIRVYIKEVVGLTPSENVKYYKCVRDIDSK